MPSHERVYSPTTPWGEKYNYPRSDGKTGSFRVVFHDLLPQGHPEQEKLQSVLVNWLSEGKKNLKSLGWWVCLLLWCKCSHRGWFHTNQHAPASARSWTSSVQEANSGFLVKNLSWAHSWDVPLQQRVPWHQGRTRDGWTTWGSTSRSPRAGPKGLHSNHRPVCALEFGYGPAFSCPEVMSPVTQRPLSLLCSKGSRGADRGEKRQHPESPVLGFLFWVSFRGWIMVESWWLCLYDCYWFSPTLRFHRL